MSDDADTWQSRLHTFGHTGWRDPIIYAYDQLERLYVIGRLLSSLELQASGSVAIDFGCGTGDFSRLLVDMGMTVYGYDPFVAPRWTHDRFAHVNSLERLAQSVSDADLVLSVTVLDHIVDDARFHVALQSIRERMRVGGYLCLLEYALEEHWPAHARMRANDLQSFRTLGAWRNEFDKNGLSLIQHYPVPHPTVSPSEGYQSYVGNIAVRLLRRSKACHTKLGRRTLTGVAHYMLRRHPPKLPHGHSSPLKCMICCKI